MSMSQKFNYTVSLTNLTSNITVEFTEIWDYPGFVRDDTWETAPVFIWTDGNYSCDCNRNIFFYRSGLHSDDYEDVPCGEVLFKLNWIRNDETGKIVYSSEEPSA